MTKRKNSLEWLQRIIEERLFTNNWTRTVLEKLEHSTDKKTVLSSLSSVFNKREYEKVRQFLADFFAGEIVDIADGAEVDKEDDTPPQSIAKAKLRIETRKWLMEHLSPERYGNSKPQKTADAVRSFFKAKVYLPDNGRD
ncbi:terminase small subunit-like protein [Sneathiella aquimaris]|uniref:terminase small subunit-like protein n=1 Tax=Sneathiella aquimaris TaxID=2599305 RepID=UPI00146EF87C|nr:hypothetical protein [Sneathiella aquimaris]